jgi:UDP-glucose 4-epimerase
MARYGNAVPPFTESTIPQPVDPYGLAKLQAEQQLNLLSDIHGLRVIHVVPHNVCGPGQCYSDPYRNVMSIFTNRVLHDKNIYVYGDGKQKRSFSHVDDCVEAYASIVENKHIKSKEVFNIGPSDGSEITILELANKVAAYCNKQANITHLPDRPQEVKNAWVSTTKAETELNYSTKKSTDDVIRDTTTWIKNSPKRDFNYHLNLEIITEKTPKTWSQRLFND